MAAFLLSHGKHFEQNIFLPKATINACHIPEMQLVPLNP